MSTHLYVSPAAAGKTRWVIDAVRQSAGGLQETPVVVVATPLQAASVRGRLAQAGGALGVHILTFDELYVLLLQHCGGAYTELVGPVRFRLLRGAIEAAHAARHLPFYSALAGSAGFAHIVQRLIELFKGAAVSPEALAAALAAAFPSDGEDAKRLGELALLYANYQRLLQSQGWSDRAGMGWLALAAAQGCDCPLPPPVRLLVFDGFADFTEIQLQVIAALAARLPQVVVTLTGDVPAANGEVDPQPNQRLYARTARRLAAALNVRAEPLPELLTSPTPQIEMIETTNQAAEVRAALRWLKQRIVEDGCRPQETALLARSLQPYRAALVQVAAEFGLPLCILDGLPLAQNPAIAALLDLLRLALPADDGSGLDLPRRGVIEAWRSPYFDWGDAGDALHESAADLLLEAALAGRVVRGQGQWSEALAQFAIRSAADENAASEVAQADAAATAATAAALTARFNRFVAAITPPASGSFATCSGWLEHLIGDDDATAQEQVQERTAGGEPVTQRLPRLLACVQTGAGGTASRDMAALRAFKDVLRGLIWAEMAAAAAGEAPQSVSYAQFLDELIGTVNAATYQPPIPAGGAVLVATAAQARGAPLTAVAVLGLAEGEFPARISEDPLLRDADRRRLQAQGLALELSTLSYERELFADCLSRASRRLLLTRPRLAEGGAEWEPSPFWRELCDQTKITPLRLLSSDRTQPPASTQELMERLARQPTPEPAALAWLQRTCPGRWQAAQHGAVMALERRRRQLSPFDGDLTTMAGALKARYGAAHVWSPSRLESYITCRFLFFTGSVLRFAVREEPAEGLDVAQLGTIYHRIFERAYRAAANACDLAVLRAVAIEVADAVLAAAPRELGFRATAWWEQECAAIRARVLQTLENLHASDGDRYLPFAFEQHFGVLTPPLAIVVGDETLLLRGVIDRIDRDRETGKLRVIDYKTGSSGFDAGGLREGKKLQLPLYALAAQEALGLGEVQEGFYWLINRGERSSLQLSRWEGGPAAAIATAVAHVHAAAQGVRAGQFAGRAPADGCPSYCPAAAFCAHYREK